MEKKRNRKPNWTEEQGLLLAQLVNEHKGMLRGIFGPTVTSQGKRRAWDTISQTINASFPLVVRTGDDCEKRWYVLQSKAKDEISAHKRESSLTGGGPPAKRLSQVADTVFQVLGHSEVSVTGLPTGIEPSMMQALEMQQSMETSQDAHQVCRQDCRLNHLQLLLRIARRIKHHSHPKHLLLPISSPNVDPCESYTSLHDFWRSTRNYNNFYYYSGTCDYNMNWNGWYRLFYYGLDAQIPESCVISGSCGTSQPLWLNGHHPQPEEGVVTRQVCGSSYWSGCCGYSYSIRVKACPGDYYVYELVSPTSCSVYCTVPFTSPNVDPCDSYTSLYDVWRSTNNYNYYYNYYYGTCDYNFNWNGWYRLFLYGQDAQMPESCVSSGSCGTSQPLWLNGHHPQPEEGVVTRQVCTSNWYECSCYSTYSINVKACPGDYYVYELVSPTFCSTYCTDSVEICESSSGFFSVSRCQLFEDGFSSEDLHLRDPYCKGTVRDGRVEFRFDYNNLCGTNLVANGTHFIYENVILGNVKSTQLISRKSYLNMTFSCIYSQTQTFSMNAKINPLESYLHKMIPAGQGTYRIRIVPYQDPQFSQPFNGSVNIDVNQLVFVEVNVDGIDGQQFALLIDTCWATPVNDPLYHVRWDLIIGECPNSKDGTVVLVQNGVSTSGRFSFRMFTFTETSETIFLHCSIHLCLLKDNDCSAHCASYRRRRSLDFYDSSSISMGPLKRSLTKIG
ncbi:Pancreatic secretory granule membrane major glycoprotein GP2 [Triplophysa tibetana]|uniref:Pancreatic secretory granule membrane major glycoprotein GP2 n=1 Tax=Triplophysa tibetana TaxID=1572043 RepID=A0A5A9PU76_9TELE|nr:Pancreatic secretory granule membrane major glycoprotein GP2 [Triplophysa tibetana]